MASLFKRNGRYYIQFFDADRRPRVKQYSLGTTRKESAEAKMKKWQAKYEKGEYEPWSGDPPQEKPDLAELGAAFSEFMVSRSHLKPSTIKTYENILSRFVDFVGQTFPVRSLMATHIHSYLDSTDASDVTRKSYVRNIAAFVRWMLENGVVDKDITKNVRLAAVPRKFEQYLTPEGVQRILDAIDVEARENPHVKPDQVLWLKPIIEVAVRTGLRLTETCELRWNCVDFNQRKLWVRNTETFTTKNSHDRMIPIPDLAYNVLKKLRDSRKLASENDHVFVHSRGPITRLYLSKRFLKFRRKAGLEEGISFHSLRHTTASWLMSKGVNIEVIRRYMGHSSIQVTQNYIHAAEDDIAKETNEAISECAWSVEKKAA